MMKRLLILALSAVALLFSTALSEEASPPPLGEPFAAVYQIDRIIRMEPVENSEFVCHVPKGARLFLTPVNEFYAATAYEGLKGYIFYPDAIPNEVAVTPLEPYYAAVTDEQYAYQAPHYSADILKTYPAKSLVWITGRAGDFAVAQEEGETSYLPARSIAAIRPDTENAPLQTVMNEADVLLFKPVQGAPALCVVPTGASVIKTALNGDYAAIQYQDQLGYVLKTKLAEGQREKKQFYISVLEASAVVYTAPNPYAFADRFLERGALVCVDGVTGGFAHIQDLDVYVQTQCLQKVNQAPLDSFHGYWDDDQPLYSKTGARPITLDAVLKRHTPLEISLHAAGGYYLVKADGQWVYIKKEGMKPLKEATLPNRTAAVAQKGMAVKQAPFADIETIAVLEEDIPLWLDRTLNGFASIGLGGSTGYVELALMETIGEDIKTPAYEAYISKDAALMDFPDSGHGKALQTLPGNTLVKISMLNGAYAQVTADGQTGYLALESASALDRLFEKDDGNRYVIFLNKSTYELCVYNADKNGQKTGEPLRRATIAIGKRTTPTPAGEFALGKRERWHYFGPSYAPFAIEYAPGRYLHGPLYYSASEKALNKGRLKDFGTMSTGGCLRMPYEDILWIYCHCNENNTKLEIVNGI